MGSERQDCCNYDEIRILAEDARRRRRRTNIWTTALIAGAMVVTGLYVGTTSEEMQALDDEVQALEDIRAEQDNLRAQINELQRDRELLSVERDLYRQAANWLAGDRQTPLTSSLTINNRPDPSEPTVTPQPEPIAMLRDIVWLVEGSRRVPMTDGDYLWIPEARAWMEVEDIIAGQVNIYFDRDRRTNPQSTTLPIDLGTSGPNAANHACIALLPNSGRVSLTDDYRDIDIRFQPHECGSPYTPINPPPVDPP